MSLLSRLATSVEADIERELHPPLQFLKKIFINFFKAPKKILEKKNFRLPPENAPLRLCRSWGGEETADGYGERGLCSAFRESH